MIVTIEIIIAKEKKSCIRCASCNDLDLGGFCRPYSYTLKIEGSKCKNDVLSDF